MRLVQRAVADLCTKRGSTVCAGESKVEINARNIPAILMNVSRRQRTNASKFEQKICAELFANTGADSVDI
jgi:hypothetical protein